MEVEVEEVVVAVVPALHLPMKLMTPPEKSVRDFLLRCFRTKKNHRRCEKFVVAMLAQRLSATRVAPSNLWLYRLHRPSRPEPVGAEVVVAAADPAQEVVEEEVEEEVVVEEVVEEEVVEEEAEAEAEAVVAAAVAELVVPAQVRREAIPKTL